MKLKPPPQTKPNPKKVKEAKEALAKTYGVQLKDTCGHKEAQLAADWVKWAEITPGFSEYYFARVSGMSTRHFKQHVCKSDVLKEALEDVQMIFQNRARTQNSINATARDYFIETFGFAFDEDLRRKRDMDIQLVRERIDILKKKQDEENNAPRLVVEMMKFKAIESK